MELSVAGYSIDTIRLIVSLMVVLQAAMIWLIAEPVVARALPALPLRRRTTSQRLILYSIAAFEIVLAFALMVLLDLRQPPFP